MSQAILDLAYQLTRAGEPFVLATVVWCERPTSAKPGAQAIIRQNGDITGWIGGSCTQPVVIREALETLREEGDPYLLHLGTPEEGRVRNDVRTFPMTCASGGALDVYIEPHLPAPRLVLIGASPVIDALRRITPVLGFTVTHLEQTDLGQLTVDKRTYILIATHGQYDEEILRQVLPDGPAYVGMVASRRRADECRAVLQSSGLTECQLARLHAPAGLDIGAVTPEEIAASILAELVQMRRRRTHSEESRATPEPVAADKQNSESETVLDPVCGMIVTIGAARHRSSYNGREFFFCCPACKRLFDSDPQNYLAE